jgi:hypothetical protein
VHVGGGKSSVSLVVRTPRNTITLQSWSLGGRDAPRHLVAHPDHWPQRVFYPAHLRNVIFIHHTTIYTNLFENIFTSGPTNQCLTLVFNARIKHTRRVCFRGLLHPLNGELKSRNTLSFVNVP